MKKRYEAVESSQRAHSSVAERPANTTKTSDPASIPTMQRRVLLATFSSSATTQTRLLEPALHIL